MNLKKEYKMIMSILFIGVVLILLPTISDASTALYIGNSKTYYNSLPRMVYNLSDKDGDTNTPVMNYIAMTYGGRTLKQHAIALRGTYRTIKEKTTLDNLVNNSKYDAKYGEHKSYFKYFQKGGYKNEKLTTYEKEIYEGYLNVLQDSNKKVRKYDYVILQEARDPIYNYSSSNNDYGMGVKTILEILKENGSINYDTPVIINSVWFTYSQYFDDNGQKKIDSNSETIKKNMENQGYKNIRIAYSGRAFLNYFKLAKGNETVELNKKTFPAGVDNAINDLFVKDKVHPTQLGTYIEACCIYLAMFEKSPYGIKYQGLIHDMDHNSNAGYEYRILNYSSLKYGNNYAYKKINEGDTINKLQKCIDINPAEIKISYSTTNPTKNDVKVTISSNEKIKELSGWTLATDKMSISKTYTKNITETVKVLDLMENESSATISIKNIDKEVPEITNIGGNSKEWTQSKTISITANDKKSGIAGYYVGTAEPNSSTIFKENTSFEIKSNGKYYISAKDKVGNIAKETIEVIAIDTEKPIIDTTTQVHTEDNKTEVTINAIDNQSGIKKYSFDGGKTWQTSKTKSFDYGLASQKINIMVEDRVGRYSDIKEVEVTFEDKIKPEIISINGNTDELTQIKIITILATDEGSGIAGYYVGTDEPNNSSTTFKEETSFEISVNGTYYVAVKDKAGNITKTTIYVTKIGNILPEPDPEPEPKPIPTITIENNGGTFVIPTGNEKTIVRTVIKANSESDCIIYYGLSNSNRTEPESYKKKEINTLQLDLSLPEGNWYLWTYAEIQDGENIIASEKYVSNVFQIKFNVKYDTTSKETCIEKVEIIDDVTYLIVKSGTKKDELLGYIDSYYDIIVESNNELEKLSTSDIIKIGDSENARIVVQGDVTEDGEINFDDIVKLNSYRLEVTKLNKAQILAGDYTADGKIDFDDIVRINEYRLNNNRCAI